MSPYPPPPTVVVVVSDSSDSEELPTHLSVTMYSFGLGTLVLAGASTQSKLFSSLNIALI